MQIALFMRQKDGARPNELLGSISAIIEQSLDAHKILQLDFLGVQWFPKVDTMPSKEEIETKFVELNSPIFKCEEGTGTIALLLENIKDKTRRVA